LDHLSLTPNIKWFLELWLTYIQPWKFNLSQQQAAQPQQQDPNTPYSEESPHIEFLIENFPVYTDIYHLILKRYCIVDLTNAENLRMMKQILGVFSMQMSELKKCKHTHNTELNTFNVES
jgi:hypothetical protein